MLNATLQTGLISDRNVWVITLANNFTENLTLLISKVSEAVLPETPGNHIGPGAAMDAFLQKQRGVRFMINGGFSHYRKEFYEWPHQNYAVGDPVGLVKIRDHYYEDMRERGLFGFFVQTDKRQPWRIVREQALLKTEKYILGCTPLLIFEGTPQPLPQVSLAPLPAGQITPPSILAHGLQPHPRTAIGLRGNELVFVIVEGDGQSGGCTLPELQTLGQRLNLEAFLNLDGGGSSQFRLWDGTRYIHNHIAPEDTQRVLGHVLVVFDEGLK